MTISNFKLFIEDWLSIVYDWQFWQSTDNNELLMIVDKQLTIVTWQLRIVEWQLTIVNAQFAWYEQQYLNDYITEGNFYSVIIPSQDIEGGTRNKLKKGHINED